MIHTYNVGGSVKPKIYPNVFALKGIELMEKLDWGGNPSAPLKSPTAAPPRDSSRNKRCTCRRPVAFKIATERVKKIKIWRSWSSTKNIPTWRLWQTRAPDGLSLGSRSEDGVRSSSYGELLLCWLIIALIADSPPSGWRVIILRAASH